MNAAILVLLWTGTEGGLRNEPAGAFSTLVGKVGPLVVVLLAVYLTYRLGLRAYKEQKAIGECRQRYLTEGLGVLVSDLGRVVAASRRNWLTAQFRLTRFEKICPDSAMRSLPLPFEPERFEPPTIGLGHLHRVEELLGMNRPPEMSALRKWYFVALADHSAMGESVVADVALVLKYPGAFAAVDRTEMVQVARKELNTCYRRWCQRHEMLLVMLTELSSILWKQQITYESLPELPGETDVLQVKQAIEEGWREIEKQEKERHGNLSGEASADS